MEKLTRQCLKITSTLLCFLCISTQLLKASDQQSVRLRLSLEEATNLRLEHPDSSLKILQAIYTRSFEKADTLASIQALLELSHIYGHQANYKESYDRLWTALLLADAADLQLLKASIYREIGRYYSFYKRKEDALKFLNLSLTIKKKLVEKNELDPARLVANYHAFAATYRELNQPELCKTYLDSSFLYHSEEMSKINKSSLRFERAVLLNEENKYEEAIDIFSSVLPWYSENLPGYQVLVYYYMGDSYFALGNFGESERCYKKALEISENYNSHIDFTPLVHEKLSDLYFSRGDFKKAYASLKTVQKLDKKFFDSRSENNRPLLEIQDEFRKNKEGREKLLQEQRLAQLENEDKVLLLQRTILIGSLVFLVLIGFLYFKDVRSKHNAEKLFIQKEQELERQKSHELVEMKNKELAASVLKLIEKDAFIDSLKDRLSKGNGEIKRHEIVHFFNSISHQNTENWKEFEARFVSVNKSFYEKLTQKFPALTQGDLKLCALIKLSFSSKEMAKLLGISVESVHTTRYRLRKKLKLSREDNLTEFIANV